LSSQPLVSIIVPLYNSEKYIEETINSVLAQTWPNKELILVDDGSDDRSLAIAKSFSSEIMKVFSQENRGASSARNRGLREARGEFIQFLDADDLLSPDKISVQIATLKDRRDLLAISDTIYFTGDIVPAEEKPAKEWYGDIHNDPVEFLTKLYGGTLIGPEYGGMVTIHSWLTPRVLIDRAGPWDERLSTDDDGEFFCRVILESSGIRYAEGVFNYYRKFNFPGSLSSQNNRASQMSKLLATDLKTQHLVAKRNDNQVKLALARLYYDNAFSFYPKYPDLAKEAENKARNLSPELPFRPFSQKNDLPGVLSKWIGWKAVRYLQHLKNYNNKPV